jgi:hypothetical protein
LRDAVRFFKLPEGTGAIVGSAKLSTAPSAPEKPAVSTEKPVKPMAPKPSATTKSPKKKAVATGFSFNLSAGSDDLDDKFGKK